MVYEAVRREGEEELSRPLIALWWSGLAAGLSMGFSFIAEGLLSAYLTNEAWQPAITKFGYSVGFLIVILGCQQLFTENTLTPMLQLFSRFDLATLSRTAQLWVVVLFANIVGIAIFACVIAYAHLFEPGVREVMVELSVASLEGDFGNVLIRGVFAGWLIALMLWLMPFAETARFGVIILITYIIGLAHFTHIIAGSVEALFAVFAGHVHILTYVGKFFVPTLIGNIIGGVALVAAINYAQVAATGSEQD